MPAAALTPRDLKRRLDAGDDVTVLDVREPWEVEVAPFPGALWIPLGDLAERADEVPEDRPVVCVCHHGVRSAWAARMLAEAGLDDVYNLTGGVDRWSREVDPRFPRY